ncbi:MAG: transglycosylase SLT domain-containing protein [Pyrinomonadaceae bacterium]
MVRSSINSFVLIFFTIILFSFGCSAQTEEQAQQSLRQMTRDGKLPAEYAVAPIESRFAGRKTGVLARLLRARIRFESGDYVGAADLLNSTSFKEKTSVGDYALWLRARALDKSGDPTGSMAAAFVFRQEYPHSIHLADVQLLWAESALAAGKAKEVPAFLEMLNAANNADALLLTAKAFEAQSDQGSATKYFRKVYFFGAGTNAAKQAEAKLPSLAQPLTPRTADEIGRRADDLYKANKFAEARIAYLELLEKFPASFVTQTRLRMIVAMVKLKKMTEARAAFDSLPASATEREEGYYHLATGYAESRQWPAARAVTDEMREKFPKGKLLPKTFIHVGYAARDARNRAEEAYYLRTAVASYPDAVEVAGAQFELAWLEHENDNFDRSSQMFIQHLARYVDKDNSNRGKAGYWAARDSERAGKLAAACYLYGAVIYRYNANWYGYQAEQRLTNLKKQGKCTSLQQDPLLIEAAANLKIVTVAAETSSQKELPRIEKAEDLTTVGLFDWAIDELEEAKKTAKNSPKINLTLAKHYRLKGDNVNALLALAKSYPDYGQMFPEEMGREEWDIFYPLIHWDDIKHWAKQRSLDPYEIAGLIRQETIFDPRARSSANAYGLMQLLIPTARSTARKFGSSVTNITGETLFQPAINIELGTAYMREQLDKFGRIEYMAIAYNAGPNRVAPWRATLPYEMDEFVEAIPFRETKGYVQGIIRNTAQYRRLYDENGKFKVNVGARPLRGEIDSRPAGQIAEEFPDVVVDIDPNS